MPFQTVRKSLSERRPRAKEVRSCLPGQVLERSTLYGVLLFVAAFSVYLLFAFLTLTSQEWLVPLLYSVLQGISIAVLFVVGHDACHGSLTASAKLNRIIARLCFLPGYHSYSHWDLGHNQLHHGWTNLAGMDHVWTPLTKREFDKLPLSQKCLERFYRTAWGLGFYYFWEIWWKQGLAAKEGPMSKLRQEPAAMSDVRLLAAFFTLQVFICVSLAFSLTGALNGMFCASVIKLIFISIVLPFMIWNYLMGLAIYLHHTHPNVVWYNSREEWDFYRGQVEGTVYVELPRVLDSLFGHIMVHTAHHVNPKIPSYHLRSSQSELHKNFGEDIRHWRWNFRTFFDALRRCKLYDYQNHRWLDFAGNPTSPSQLT